MEAERGAYARQCPPCEDEQKAETGWSKPDVRARDLRLEADGRFLHPRNSPTPATSPRVVFVPSFLKRTATFYHESHSVQAITETKYSFIFTLHYPRTGD